MSIHADIQSDWDCPYPFRMLVLHSERDPELGQWSVTFGLLGIACTLTWVYEETALRKELTDMMEDEDWLAKSRVSMPHADYAALKADADKWRESQA